LNRTLVVVVLMWHPLWRGGGFVSNEYAWPFVIIDLPPLLPVEATGIWYWLETLKSSVQLFINLHKDCGVT
jgi:hypothetical protein